MKIGELVFITESGTCFEGASGIVTELNTGANGKYTRVRFLLATRIEGGRMMQEALFHPEHVRRENRPWLRKHLKHILALRRKLGSVSV